MDRLPPWLLYDILTDDDNAVVNVHVLRLVSRSTRASVDTVVAMPGFWRTLSRACFPKASPGLWLPRMFTMLGGGGGGGDAAAEENMLWCAQFQYIVDGLLGVRILQQSGRVRGVTVALSKTAQRLAKDNVVLAHELRKEERVDLHMCDAEEIVSAKFAVGSWDHCGDHNCALAWQTRCGCRVPGHVFYEECGTVWWCDVAQVVQVAYCITLGSVTVDHCATWLFPPRCLAPPAPVPVRVSVIGGFGNEVYEAVWPAATRVGRMLEGMPHFLQKLAFDMGQYVVSSDDCLRRCTPGTSALQFFIGNFAEPDEDGALHLRLSVHHTL